MHIWTTPEVPLNVAAGPLRPHLFGARLYFRDQSTVHEIPGKQQDGFYRFPVSLQQVSLVMEAKAYLFITTRQVLHPGSADLRWGWRYSCSEGNPTAVTASPDTQLQVDSDGFIRSPLMKFDDPVELAHETIVFRRAG